MRDVCFYLNLGRFAILSISELNLYQFEWNSCSNMFGNVTDVGARFLR